MVQGLDFTETNGKVVNAVKSEEEWPLSLPHHDLIARKIAGTVFCSRFGGPGVWTEYKGCSLLLHHAGMF